MFELTKEPRSKEAVEEAVQYLFANFEYTSEARESWHIDLSDLLAGKLLTDDCDGFVHAMAVFLWICGFDLKDVALCIMDTDPFDDKVFDHIVIGVHVDGDWVFCHNFIDRVLSLQRIESGGYMVGEFRAGGMGFVQYRLLDHSSDDWLKGIPRYG